MCVIYPELQSLQSLSRFSPAPDLAFSEDKVGATEGITVAALSVWSLSSACGLGRGPYTTGVPHVLRDDAARVR